MRISQQRIVASAVAVGHKAEMLARIHRFNSPTLLLAVAISPLKKAGKAMFATGISYSHTG